MANEQPNILDTLKNPKLIKCLKAIENDPEIKILIAQSLGVLNVVLPAGWDNMDYYSGKLATLWNDERKERKVISFYEEYGDVLSAFNWLSGLTSSEGAYIGQPIKVTTNDYFYHGTSYENYLKILDTGYIKATDYLNGVEANRLNDPNITNEELLELIEYCTNETGKVFITDSIVTSMKYATRWGGKGAVLCLDLSGYDIESLYNRNNRQFISRSVIPIDRIKKVYSVDVIDNQLVVNEMEGAK